ncbi:MAG: ATP-dependent helicase HrpB [Bacteroidetes bacterium]|nr:MAG: ATP-dependent helicase HrpB [Bacteroidota bacterium]
MSDLPIDAVLPELRAALRSCTRAVVQAPPGAGKTTQIPLALRDEPWLAGQRIVLLEPRRLAARAAARRMAHLLGEPVGETVGYRIRLEHVAGPRTRIEVVTEGILTRLLQDDPGLDGIGLVLFDEFHERSLHADLGLALCLHAQALLRPDLRLLVMSATLDGARVARLLDDAPQVVSEGRSYPVQTHYLRHRPEGRLEATVAAAVHRALHETEGDVLVFLPGAGEIRRTAARLAEGGLPPEVQMRPLYGNLPPADQQAAIEPSPPGRRKVVLATAIAESSLTIEGVHVVIDSGLAREPQFSPRTGMTRLVTRRVSIASADQRRGRAGRLGPGVCYRLWPASDQPHLAAHPRPEILQADLAPLALELALWGAGAEELRWLDPPPAAALQQARTLLHDLGALDAAGRITPHGRRMARIGAHPRLAHMLFEGRRLGHGRLACRLAALLSERDVLRSDAGLPEIDVRLRLDLLRQAERGSVPARYQGYPVARSTVRRVLQLARQWERRLRPDEPRIDPEAAGLVLAFAYPDRIALQERPGRFRLRNGHRAVVDGPQRLSEADVLVAASLDGDRRESRLFLAAPLTRADLAHHFAHAIETIDRIAWDAAAGRVTARRQERLGALILQDGPLPDPDPEAVRTALLDGLADAGLAALPWTPAARSWQQRILFLRPFDPSLPDVSDAHLLGTLSDWLGPYLTGMKRLEDLQRLDLSRILQDMLTWEQRQRLDTQAPTHLTVPSGSRIRLDYSDPEAPVLAVRLQELFGLTETPRIAGGRVPLTIHLLSPAHRPVQITRDLAGFWASTYFEVKKELMGRYPRHYWPDDPLSATPTHRARPRR